MSNKLTKAEYFTVKKLNQQFNKAMQSNNIEEANRIYEQIEKIYK